MVLVKILMEIDPLPMRGSMVMTMVMISPSRWDVSPAELLRCSPRLVPPRFRLMAAEFRPESLLMIFFPRRKTPYSQRWASEGHQGAHEAGAHPGGRARPHPRGQGVTPSGTFSAQYFLLIPKRTSVKFQDFWRCVE